MTIRKIFAATDFSGPARAAVARAAALAGARGAKLVVAHVLNPALHEAATGAPLKSLDQERAAVQRSLEAACTGLTATLLQLVGYPDEEIVEASQTEAADLIVLGSHGRTGLRRMLLGSVAENVVRASTIPVLVGRGAAGAAFERILVATDFSEPAGRALELALELAAPGASVEVQHVVFVPATFAGDPPMVLDVSTLRALEEAAAAQGAALVERHRREGIGLRFECEIGTPRDGILNRLGKGHDLVALGSHGRRGFRRFLLGSVAETILRHAPCSVLVAK